MNKTQCAEHLAYIGLGSNIGDRRENLERALTKINRRLDSSVLRRASIYETAPVGYTAQPDFLNTVAEIQTILSPADLLTCLQEVEKTLGRVRTLRWGPRTIDLDILLYDDLSINRPDLTIPHPRMMERAFVLVPLAQLIPHRLLAGRSLRELAEESLSRSPAIKKV